MGYQSGILTTVTPFNLTRSYLTKAVNIQIYGWIPRDGFKRSVTRFYYMREVSFFNFKYLFYPNYHEI